MRAIEIQMNKAIQACINFKKGNTKVLSNRDNSLTVSEISMVYLHGNLIAMVGDTWIRLFDGGWRTATTKSRLNAILSAHGNGERIYQKDFTWYLAQPGKDPIPFHNGIRLD
jgi:hypothetical protein